MLRRPLVDRLLQEVGRERMERRAQYSETQCLSVLNGGPVRNRRGGGMRQNQGLYRFRAVPRDLPQPHLAFPSAVLKWHPAAYPQTKWRSLEANRRDLLMTLSAVGLHRVLHHGVRVIPHLALMRPLNGPKGARG